MAAKWHQQNGGERKSARQLKIEMASVSNVEEGAWRRLKCRKQAWRHRGGGSSAIRPSAWRRRKYQWRLLNLGGSRKRRFSSGIRLALISSGVEAWRFW
jgi:hypothetical protein